MAHVKRKWTAEDTEKLVRLWGKPDTAIKDIATVLKRTEAVVRAKVSRLRKTRPDLKKALRLRTVYKNYKLTRHDIPKIRADRRSLRLIGDDYGVSPVTIFKVKNHETWKDA